MEKRLRSRSLVRGRFCERLGFGILRFRGMGSCLELLEWGNIVCRCFLCRCSETNRSRPQLTDKNQPQDPASYLNCEAGARDTLRVPFNGGGGGGAGVR